MIVVRVELLSAITGRTTELARMHIFNIGNATGRRHAYEGQTFIGRDTAALDRGTVSKEARVEDYPRDALHVWNLVARMLAKMGYTK